MGLCPCFSVVWLGLEPSSHPFSKIQTRWPRLGTPPCACVGEGGCLVQMLGSWLMGLMTLGNWNYSLWKRKDHLCCSLYTVDLVCSCMNGYLAGMWPGKKYLLALWDEETQHGDRRRLWGGVKMHPFHWQRERMFPVGPEQCTAPPMYPRHENPKVC